MFNDKSRKIKFNNVNITHLNFKNEHTMQLLDNVNNLQAEYDIAEIIHFLYRDEFVCVDLKQNTWFYFNGVKWIENKEAYTLSNKLSKENIRENIQKVIYEAIIH